MHHYILWSHTGPLNRYQCERRTPVYISIGAQNWIKISILILEKSWLAYCTCKTLRFQTLFWHCVLVEAVGPSGSWFTQLWNRNKGDSFFIAVQHSRQQCILEDKHLGPHPSLFSHRSGNHEQANLCPSVLHLQNVPSSLGCHPRARFLALPVSSLSWLIGAIGEVKTSTTRNFLQGLNSLRVGGPFVRHFREMSS